MKGSFSVFRNQSEDFDIKCEIRPEIEGEIPEEQLRLYGEVEKTCNIIKTLEKTGTTVKEKYFAKLLSLAQAGMVSEEAQPELALISLENLKEEILLAEGTRIKNTYMIYLGIAAVIIAVITGIAAVIFHKVIQKQEIVCVYLVVLGALAGTWVSFGARKFEITFEDLASLEKDRMNPVIRLIYISVTAIILLFFLNIGIIEVKLGNLDTIEALTEWKSALVIGLMCGLVESKIGVKVYDQVKHVIGEELPDGHE